ncbi:regulatory protein RecX [Microbacterium sp. CJ88]|uniref:regulatory protein RecX n=1 Tax=Microbacterium sp. CJ88 TaxID=3445672 RepID=UPI003F65836E
MGDHVNGGGGSERLAPVIPLFGRRTENASAREAPAVEVAEASVGAAESGNALAADDADSDVVAWNDTWSELLPNDTTAATDTTAAWGESASDDRRAVGDRRAQAGDVRRRDAESSGRRSFSSRGDDQGQEEAERDPARVREQAEASLLRKLRSRSLSVVEARRVLADGHVDRADVDDVIDGFLHLGYLDDVALAEQLVHSGADRKGQGRQAIAQVLAKRGIPREVADAAIAELPDDDADRALEFAQTKARSLDRLDDEVAYRRLVGALSRRGYGGSVASTAARSALAERRAERGSGGRQGSGGGRSGGVRFR